MILESPRQPLVAKDVPRPAPRPDQLLVRVAACAVCRTDLHVLDGELPEPKLPLILGHEIVGRVEEIGAEVRGFEVGQRVGIPWLGWTCGECKFCRTNRENSVRTRALHRLHDRWRLRGIHRGRRAFLFSHSGRLRRCRGRAAAVRGVDRLSLSAQGRRCAAARDLRVRRRRAHRRAGRAAPGSRGLRVHQAGRHRGAGVRAPSRRAVGRRFGRTSARTTGRRHHLRAGRSARARRRCASWNAAARSSAAAFT